MLMFVKRIPYYKFNQFLIFIQNTYLFLWLKGPLGIYFIKSTKIKLFFNRKTIYFISLYKEKLYCFFKKLIINFKYNLLTGQVFILNFRGLGLKFLIKRKTIFFLLGYSHSIKLLNYNKIQIYSHKKNNLNFFVINSEIALNLITKIIKLKPINMYTIKGIAFLKNFILKKKIGKKQQSF